MENLRDELSLLFKNDKTYKTSVSAADERTLKSIWSGIDINRVVAYNLSKGLLKKKSVIFMKTGVRVDNHFFTLLGCEAIEKKGSSYVFYYVDTVSTFKIDKDIVDYLQKMLEITLKYEQKGHDYAYGNGVEKNIDKALYYYNEIIGLDYNYQQGIFSSSVYAYHQRKKYLIAYAYCKKALEYNYDVTYSYCLLGMMHHYGQDIPVDLEKALYYYDEGLKIDPHDSNICLHKAQLYLYTMRKYDQVLDVATQAKDPTRLYTVLGTCYSRGYGCDIDISKGNNYLKKAISNKDYRAYHQLTLNAITSKDGKHILEYLKEYSKHFKDYNNLYGKIYLYGIGVEVDNDKAIDYFVKSLEENPNDTSALYFLAKIYFEAGEYEAAYEYMEECYNKDSVNCNYFLSELYRQGIIVEKSDKKRKELLQEGANKDDGECLVGLADFCFENSLYDKGYEYLQRATVAETEDNFAILSYIYYVENKIGIKKLLEMHKHFEFIHKIYEKRKNWFYKDYCRLKDLYINYIIQISKLKKTKDLSDMKGNERAKAIYVYSGTKTHAFLLTEYLIVKEVDKSLVDFKRDELGSYYTVFFDKYKNVENVKIRLKIDDLISGYDRY